MRHKIATSAARTTAFMAARLSQRNLESWEDFSTWKSGGVVSMAPVPPANAKIIKPNK